VQRGDAAGRSDQEHSIVGEAKPALLLEVDEAETTRPL